MLFYVFTLPGQPGSVIITQPTVVTTIVQQFKDIPVQTNCPSCHAEIITSIEFETGTLTWLLCVIICLVGYVASHSIYLKSCMLREI